MRPADAFHPDEAAARIELAACYRIFAMLGWTEMIYNHITVRLPDSVTRGNGKQFLINPFGLEAMSSTPTELADLIKKDTAKWGPIVKEVGFTAEG